MAANPAKFQLMFLGDKDILVDNVLLEPTNCVKLLGINIDCKLNFTPHVYTDTMQSCI